MGITPRWYQKVIIEQILLSIKKGFTNIMTSAPTGAGKTIIMLLLAKRFKESGLKVLITVHRSLLKDQTVAKLSNYADCETLQTLNNRAKLDYDIVFVDEAHYGAKGNMQTSLRGKLLDATFISMTATPIDNAGYLLGGYDDYNCDIQLPSLMGTFLVPCESRVCTTLDLSNVKITAGEYNAEQIAEIVIDKYLLQSIYTQWFDLRCELGTKNLKTMVYGSNIQHAESIAEIYRLNGVRCGIIHSKIKNNDYQDFLDNKLEVVVNVEMLTAGNDIPDVVCIVNGSPSLAERKFLQILGRGARMIGQTYEESCKNGKPKMYYLDFCNSIANHGAPEIIRRWKKKPVIGKMERLLSTTVTEVAGEVVRAEEVALLKKCITVRDMFPPRYRLESDFQKDVNKVAKRVEIFDSTIFYYRQNSGMAMFENVIKQDKQNYFNTYGGKLNERDGKVLSHFISCVNGTATDKTKNRPVWFTSKFGLPDSVVLAGPIYIGIELKTHTGRLTPHQLKTLPEMEEAKVFFMIVRNIDEFMKSIFHVRRNIIKDKSGVFVKNQLYVLPDWQMDLRRKLKLKGYDNEC